MIAIEEIHNDSHVAPEGFPNNEHVFLILWIKKKHPKLDSLMYISFHNSIHKKNISPHRDLIPIISTTTTTITYG